MSIKPGHEKPSSPGGRRTYQKPVLIRGPVLTDITAAIGTVSGLPTKNFCWIARAAFGEADLRWIIFREWLVADAPAWFRDLYIRHGETVGAWLEGRARMRGIVRTLMMPAVNRTLRK
jgi:hypothetical protein